MTDADFKLPYRPTKLAYMLGDRLNKLAPPVVVQPHAGGLIIKIPEEGAAMYLERVLSLKALNPDDELVECLQLILNSSRRKP